MLAITILSTAQTTVPVSYALPQSVYTGPNQNLIGRIDARQIKPNSRCVSHQDRIVPYHALSSMKSLDTEVRSKRATCSNPN